MSVGRFVDAESLVVAWLTEMLPGVRVVTKLPESIAGLELIRVIRSPGDNDSMSARPRVDVECFSPNRARMWILAGRANDALARLSGHVVTFPVGEGDETASEQVDTVNTVTDPVPGFWSPNVERSVAVYQLDLRVF